MYMYLRNEEYPLSSCFHFGFPSVDFWNNSVIWSICASCTSHILDPGLEQGIFKSICATGKTIVGTYCLPWGGDTLYHRIIRRWLHTDM